MSVSAIAALDLQGAKVPMLTQSQAGSGGEGARGRTAEKKTIPKQRSQKFEMVSNFSWLAGCFPLTSARASPTLENDCERGTIRCVLALNSDATELLTKSRLGGLVYAASSQFVFFHTYV